MTKLGMLLHPERGIDAVFEEARLADEQGYDSIWLGDHIMAHGEGSRPDLPFDAMTLMIGLGAATTRVRLAWSMLNVNFRYPAMLAKVLSTLDQMTKGRVICTLGSGSVPAEHKAYDIPIVEDHDGRVAFTREVVLLLKELWTHPAPEMVSFEGSRVRTQDLGFAPAPFQKPHPPIWPRWRVRCHRRHGEGAGGRLGHAARRGSEDRLQQVLSQPDWPTRPMTIVRQIRMFTAEDRETAVAEAKASFERNPVGVGGAATDLDAFIAREIVGTPDECMTRIRELEAEGPNYLRLTFDSLDQQERVARLILPRLSETVAAVG